MRFISRKISTLQLLMVVLTTIPGITSNMYNGVESLKEGLFAASVLGAGIGLVFGNSIRFHNFNKILITISSVAILVLIHGLLKMDNTGFERNRFFLSLAFLFVLFLIWIPIANVFIGASGSDLSRGVWACHWLMLIDGIQAALQQLRGGSRQMWFAAEPSHFALSYLPFIYFITVRSGKIWYLSAAYILAVGLQNLTLLVGLTLITLLTVKRRRFNVWIVIGLVPIIIGLTPSFLEYVMARNVLDFETQNLSALVYMSGFERALNTLNDGEWFGVGFQQMGFLGSSSEIMETIRRLESDLNLYDGGTLAAKAILEFGVIAVILICAYAVYFIKVHQKITQDGSDEKNLFFSGVYLTFFCYIFVRGAGYMSINVFYFYLAICYLLFWKNRSNKTDRVHNMVHQQYVDKTT
jgi:hypothetical protein